MTREKRESNKLLEDEIIASRQQASETTLALQAQSSQLTQTSTSLETIVQLISRCVLPCESFNDRIRTLTVFEWSGGPAQGYLYSCPKRVGNESSHHSPTRCSES